MVQILSFLCYIWPSDLPRSQNPADGPPFHKNYGDPRIFQFLHISTELSSDMINLAVKIKYNLFACSVFADNKMCVMHISFDYCICSEKYAFGWIMTLERLYRFV